MTTINDHRAPCHKTTRITEREERRTPELLRTREPTEHILRLPGRPRSRILLKHLLNHRRDDMSRTETINPDPLPPPFHRQRPRKLDDSRLGRVVHGRGHALVGDEPAHARNEQYRPLPLVIEHLARCGGGRVEDAVVVDLHDFVQGRLRVFEGALQVVDACGGDQAVQPLILRGDFREDVVDLWCVAHVDASVFQGAAVFFFGLAFGGFEFGVGFFEPV